LKAESPFAFAEGQNGLLIARVLFGVALIPIGLSHLVYIKQSAALVPTWLSFRTEWAYLTGIGQIVCEFWSSLSPVRGFRRAYGSGNVELFRIACMGSRDRG
jgi:hypothetical protein